MDHKTSCASANKKGSVSFHCQLMETLGYVALYESEEKVNMTMVKGGKKKSTKGTLTRCFI